MACVHKKTPAFRQTASLNQRLASAIPRHPATLHQPFQIASLPTGN
jgi:hypothetical protein